MKEKFRWPFPKQPFPLWWNVTSSLAIFAVGTISRIGLIYLNSTVVYHRHTLLKAVFDRPSRTSLVTVSNHHSCLDDPLLSGILPWKAFFTKSKIRWTPAAHDICFEKVWHGLFFALGQTIPIVRGDGVYQRGMDFTLKQMNLGEWAHLFPEGRVNMDKTFIRLKWGVGRLISECDHVPLVLPLYHLGLDDVLPNKTPYIPRIGKKVTIAIGEPMDVEQILQTSRKLGHSALQMRKVITDSIQDELEKLREEATQIHNARIQSSS